MEANGTPLHDFHYDQEEKDYYWTVDEEYFENRGAQRCEDDFRPTDMLWQDQVETEQEPEREARRLAIIKCMRDKGFDVDPDPLYPDLIWRAKEESPECVDAQLQE